MLKIDVVATQEQHRQVRALMAEYVAWDTARTAELGLDTEAFLGFYYGSDREAVPDEFARPAGCLLLATLAGEPAGCGGFRQVSTTTCELKRLYVRPAQRGGGIARALADALIHEARATGYGSLCLETTLFMQPAIALYRSLGFEACAPYYDIPTELRGISIFMKRDLGGGK